METVQEGTRPGTGRPIITVDETEVHDHLAELVRGSVEQTLNQLLDAEADDLCGAKRYEHRPDRLDTRAGHYARSLHTKAGAVEVHVPRLRSLPFETQIIGRCPVK
jgi:putative transposase